jgi:hypothetical protein
MNHAVKVSFFDYHICTNCVFDSIQTSGHKWARTSVTRQRGSAQTSKRKQTSGHKWARTSAKVERA